MLFLTMSAIGGVRSHPETATKHSGTTAELAEPQALHAYLSALIGQSCTNLECKSRRRIFQNSAINLFRQNFKMRQQKEKVYEKTP